MTNSDKPQPIRTTFDYTYAAQVEGRQRSGNLGRDRPSWGKMGGGGFRRLPHV